MKKFVMLAVSMVLFVFLAVSAFAEEKSEAKISGLATFQSDVVVTEHESHFVYHAPIWLEYSKAVGPIKSMGLYIEPTFQNGGQEIKVSLVPKINKYVSLLFGTAADNKDANFYQVGIWVDYKVGPFSFFLDARNYFGAKSQEKGYMDNFLEVMWHPVSEKFAIGIHGVYDHFWDDDHDYLSVGPKISCELEGVGTIGLRYIYDWDFLDTGTANTSQVRFEFQIPL